MFPISDAFAQTAPAAAGAENSFMPIIMMVVLFAVFYFLLIRPQAKRQKEHKTMVEGLTKGDEVITAGGLVGRITEVSDQYVTVQIGSSDSKPVEVAVQKVAVQTLLPKGTMKSI